MIKKLVVFGCGWTYGVESDVSYPQLIADHFGWTLVDFSKQTTTLGDMIEDFEKWATSTSIEDKEESLVLVGLTNEDKVSKQKQDFYLKLKYQPENFGEKNYVYSATMFDHIANKNNINLLQFNVLTRQHKVKLPTMIESSSALEMLVIRNKPRRDPLFTEHRFPNEKGHHILADFLIEKVNSVIMTE